MGRGLGLAAMVVPMCALLVGCSPFESFDVGGVRRDVLVHSPSESDMPVLIVYHGAYSNPGDMESYTGLSELADDEGFLVAYPKAKFGTWNDGRIPDVYDDVAMTRALIDHLDAGYDIDLARVFATGISNGGFMSHRIACDLGDQVRGIAPGAGSLSAQLAEGCEGQAIAMMLIAGNEDRLVPYEGGELGGGWTGGLFGNMYSMVDSAQFWADLAQCGDATTVEIDDKEDDTALESRTYADCTNPVVLHTIKGGGHTWPGARHIPGLGTVSDELDASEAIWAFFEGL